MPKDEPMETPPISDAQREIMEIFWQRGEAGVGEVWRILSERRAVARNTVLTLITRLADKGWLLPRREGNAFRYTPAYPKEGVETMAPALVVFGFQFMTLGMEGAVHALRPLQFMCIAAVLVTVLMWMLLFRRRSTRGKRNAAKRQSKTRARAGA